MKIYLFPALFYAAVILIHWSSQAATDDCRQALACYKGEKIVFMTEPRIDPRQECMRGRAFVSAYCDPSGDQAQCDKGKVLMCRFCDEESSEVNFTPEKSVCQSLENTAAGQRKKVLTEEELYEIKAHLMNRLEQIFSQLMGAQGIQPRHLRQDNFKTETYDWVKLVSDLIADEQGLVNTFDRMGTEEEGTAKRLRRWAVTAETLWKTASAQALSLNEDQLEGWKASLLEIARIYKEIYEVVETFEYVPQD